MATNLGKPLRLRNDGGAQLQLERSTALTSLETTSGGGCSLSTAGTLALAATGANPITLATNGVTRATLDASGNLGLGVTPSAWATGVFALDIGGGSSLVNPGSVTQTWLTTNTFNDGVSFKYKGAGAAAWYQQDGGQHVWYTAGSGTSGNVITFQERLRITSDGHTLPGSNNAYDLGEAATAFRNLYAAGSIVSFAGLPTSDPGVPGLLWRSGADVKVSI
jgi:hypothetical protein